MVAGWGTGRFSSVEGWRVHHHDTDTSVASPLTAPIESVYQPIVALDGYEVVGYEALTRVHPGGPWSTIPDLLSAAEQRNVTIEFDWRCRLSALRGAAAAGLPPELMLFVNAEPAALEASPPPESLEALADADGLSITVEITERHLLRDPAGLLRSVEHARHLGWRIAVDDVGADSSSLALLPFLRPDVIKLDMGVVQSRPTEHTATVVAAVSAEADRTGAFIVAEGIETELHRRTAMDMGAQWGQGFLFGPPAPMPVFGAGVSHRRAPAHYVAVTVRAPTAVTPYGVVSALTRPRKADEALVGELGSALLRGAAAAGSSTIVLVTRGSSPRLLQCYDASLRDAAAVSALTVVFGPGGPADAAASGTSPRYRWIGVGPDEPLAKEHTIVVVSPVWTVALVALQSDCAPDGTPQYDYRVTYDRDVVLDAATTLLQRVGRC